MRRLILAALLAPVPALAHEGGDHVHGLLAGLAHPVGGLDHVLAMLAVGLWAGICGGRAAWLLPAGFLGGMALGGVLGLGGIGIPMVESGILASIIVLGALVAAAARAPVVLAVPLVAAFGLLHGHAHGAEIAAGQGAFGYAIGFLLATAALHGVGVAIARHAQAGPARFGLRIAGGSMAVLVLAVIALA